MRTTTRLQLWVKDELYAEQVYSRNGRASAIWAFKNKFSWILKSKLKWEIYEIRPSAMNDVNFRVNEEAA